MSLLVISSDDTRASQLYLLQKRYSEMRELAMQEGMHAGSAEQQQNLQFEPKAAHDGAYSEGEEEGEEEAAYYDDDDDDDDAASDASSEALALAVATEEAAQEDAAAQTSREGRQGLNRLGSLLPRRADAGQEGKQSPCLSMLREPLLGSRHSNGRSAMIRTAACAISLPCACAERLVSALQIWGACTLRIANLQVSHAS